jgi:dipeptidyl aminopeptidase/acylaminoacyl peptidase
MEIVRRLALGFVLLAACKATIDDNSRLADANQQAQLDAPIDTAPLGPWSAPVPVPIVAGVDDDPSATGDLLELYFDRGGDIWVTERLTATDAWGTPVLVAELATADTETTPEVTYDGLTLFFATQRMGGLGGRDVWSSSRSSRTSPWGAPQPVGALNTAADEAATATGDALVMVMETDRGAIGMPIDVYVTERTSPAMAWGTPAPLAGVNDPMGNDGNPMLAADRLTLYFDSDRNGDRELYVATRTSTGAAFSPPALITELAFPGGDTDPWISPDGRLLLFTSARDGTAKLWQSTR